MVTDDEYEAALDAWEAETCNRCRAGVCSAHRPSVDARAITAKALVYAYRDALREGVDPWAFPLFRGCLRELDALYPRAPFDPEPER